MLSDERHPVLERCADPAEWEELVEAASGSYLQTGTWAAVKALTGWTSLPLVLRDAGRAVAGAQVLLKATPAGHLGYVPRGPVWLPGAECLLGPLVAQLPGLCRRARVRYVVLVPPYGVNHVVPTTGWRPVPAFAHPHTEATTVLDLGQDEDQLLAGMTRKTRKNVLLARRRAPEVVEGGPDELATFHQVLQSTGRRQGFAPADLEHFRRCWEVLRPAGAVRLFLSTAEGAGVSAGLWITHRDTVTYWRGGWAGTHGGRSPNHAMHWTVLRWAKEQGYRWYDLEGVSLASASAVLSGAGRDVELSVDAFKLGFGGEVRVSPPAVGLSPNPFAQRLLTPVLSAAERSSLGERALALVRR